MASRIACLTVICGSGIGMLVAMSVSAPERDINAGLWGYNGALTLIAIGGLFFKFDLASAAVGIVGTIMASLINGALSSAFSVIGIPALTFPASITCVIFVTLNDSVRGLHPIPLHDVSVPEDHCSSCLCARRNAEATPLDLVLVPVATAQPPTTKAALGPAQVDHSVFEVDLQPPPTSAEARGHEVSAQVLGDGQPDKDDERQARTSASAYYGEERT